MKGGSRSRLSKMKKEGGQLSKFQILSFCRRNLEWFINIHVGCSLWQSWWRELGCWSFLLLFTLQGGKISAALAELLLLTRLSISHSQCLKNGLIFNKVVLACIVRQLLSWQQRSQTDSHDHQMPLLLHTVTHLAQSKIDSK